MEYRNDILRKVGATPARYIATARQRNRAGFTALRELSMVWTDIPVTLDLRVVDLFLSHLREDSVPPSGRQWQLDADFAFFALSALAFLPRLPRDTKYDVQCTAILRAWPGINKWSQYIYDAHISSPPDRQRMFLDGLIKVFFSFSEVDTFSAPMVDTPGCLELVTKLWTLDDVPVASRSAATSIGVAQTLASLLKTFACRGSTDPDIYDRVVEAAGGDAEFVIQLCLDRVKKCTKSLDAHGGSYNLVAQIDVLTHLCMPNVHPLRKALYAGDGIPLVTSAFVALSLILSRDPTEEAVTLLDLFIIFFSIYIAGDSDYLSVIRAAKAGFLLAFLDCSAAFPRMSQATIDRALAIVHDILPPYTVYRSFLEATTPFVEKLDEPHYARLFAVPMTQAAFAPFFSQRVKRLPALLCEIEIKNEGSPRRCDNMKCHHLDAKNKFKICNGCRSMYYCSPECQKLDWKATHRNLCKSLNTDRSRYLAKNRPKSDADSLQGFVQWTTDVNFAAFHEIAERNFPNIPHEYLMPCIDFTRVPETFSVKNIAVPGVALATDGDNHFEEGEDSRWEEELRVIVDKFHQVGMTTVQSLRRTGTTVELMWTPIERRNFWTDKSTE
ncbi:hypothetical protein FB45DRAFT_1059877 [Roridomyces roridus]|uniref:MYND-type domain-containing protein n=1 Tax=Roridomyces roridus TaxID=1738132 RepID=A0AAD7FLT2_9AGAR|nr:hypothetical protein FB45DRAFT_1059877 [Roridomyces roridus]